MTIRLCCRFRVVVQGLGLAGFTDWVQRSGTQAVLRTHFSLDASGHYARARLHSLATLPGQMTLNRSSDPNLPMSSTELYGRSPEMQSHWSECIGMVYAHNMLH